MRLMIDCNLWFLILYTVYCVCAYKYIKSQTVYFLKSAKLYGGLFEYIHFNKGEMLAYTLMCICVTGFAVLMLVAFFHFNFVT